MYAIIETGGKQYKVQEGDVIDVELLDSDAQGGVEFKHVLLVNTDAGVKVGVPHVNGCVVRGTCLGESKGPKVVSFKYKRRKGIRRKVGHRQHYARVKIVGISV